MYTHLKQLWLLNELTYLILNTKKCPSRADIENKLVDTVGKERVGWIERVALTYIQDYMLVGDQLGAL